MGRRQHTRLRERDDISAPGGGVAVHSAGKSLTDHVLSLQRDYGNAAVTGVVVQRAPKGKGKTLGAASTDIKDVIKIKDAKKGGKKAPEEETFWPESNPKFQGVDTPTVTAGALKWAQVHDTNSLSLATEYGEEAYVRTKALMWANLLWQVYKELGAKRPLDKKKADFWLKVKTRQLP